MHTKANTVEKNSQLAEDCKNAFSFLNNYFDKILVLSLPRLTDRINYIKKNLEGLNYEFFWGADKNKTSHDQLIKQGLYSPKLYKKYNKRPEQMNLGMLCCSLGHVKMYEYIIANNFQHTLILEDDALPLVKHLPLLPAIVKELPADWDVWYLGYEKNEKNSVFTYLKSLYYQLIPYHTSLNLPSKVFRNYFPVGVSKHIAKAGFHDCTHAYAVTLKGAGKLLKNQVPVRFNPDNLIAYMSAMEQIQSYISLPKMFDQQSAYNGMIDSLTSS